MSKSSKNVRFAGILILLGIVVGILSIAPSVDNANFLTEVYPNRYKVLTSGTFQFLLVPIHIGIALLLYPVLKHRSSSLSLGFVGFRFVAGVFQLMGVILLPLFIVLSHNFLLQSNPDLIFFETTGEILTLLRDLSNHLGVMLATGLGNLLLYYICLRGKFIPDWLSLWGVLANMLLIISSFLILFQTINVISVVYGILTIPLVIQEIVLAYWLITRGLRSEHESFESE